MKTENVWIKCEEVRLYGEIYIPKNVPAPALLICHGMNAQGFHLLKIYSELAKRACESGFVSLLFDFRGVGKSSGKFDYGFGEQEDVRCMLNYLASRPEVNPNKIFVVGHSLGGVVSIYAIRNDKRVRGLVLWSTPKNHNYSVKKFIANTREMLGLCVFMLLTWIDKLFDVTKLYKLEVYGIKLRPKDVREKLMKLNECEGVSKLNGMPLLIVVGDKDQIVGIEEAQAIFEAANGPKNLVVIESADHIYKGREEELVCKTIDWIKAVLEKI
ncbi:MAG: alpha/beta hydrolase [Candidatus Bathyarchaeales archaeon]